MSAEPGWYRDPYFLQHERYWDGGWTDRVRLVEPTPPATPAMAAATAEAAAPPSVGGDAKTSSYPAGHPADTAVITAERDAALSEPAPVAYEDDTLMVPATRHPDDTATVPATPAPAPADVDTGVLPAVAANGRAAAPPAPSPGLAARPDAAQWERAAAEEEAAAVLARSKRRRIAYVVGIGALVVIAVVVAVVSTKGGGGNSRATVGTAPPPSRPAAQQTKQADAASGTPTLQAAAAKSVAKKSAGAAVAVISADPSQSAPQHISGSGAFVLNVGLGPLSVTGAGGATKAQKFLFQGANVYVNVSDSPVPGKSWVTATTSDLPTLGSGSDLNNLVATMGNPGLLLNQLTSTPVTVSSRGASSINGVSVQVYEVSFTSGPTTTSAAGYGNHTSEEVDVGPNDVVRQIVIPGLEATVDGRQVPENIVVTFSHYAKPLVVTTPPFNELISLSQYLTRPTPPSGLNAASGNS